MDSKLIKYLEFEDEKDSIRFLFDFLLGYLNAKYISLHFISLKTNTYIRFHEAGELKLNTIDSHILFNEVNIFNINNSDGHENETLISKIERKQSCLGFLKIIFNGKIADIINIEQFLFSVKLILKIIYERTTTKKLLSNIQHPINIKHINDEDFFSEIMHMVSIASGIKLIVLRKINQENELTCIGNCGYNDEKLPSINLSNNEIIHEFKDSIEKSKIIHKSNLDDNHWTRKTKALSKVQSFVVIPVMVGVETFGLLCFATETNYVFSDLELFSLKNIANNVGVAINNYRNINQQYGDIAKYSETAVAISGLEVAQASRHEAKNIIESCNNILAKIVSKPSIKIGEVTNIIDKLTGLHSEISQVLDNIRIATKPPRLSKYDLDIEHVWDQAVSALSGKLSKYNIRAKYEGKNAKLLNGYPDWLRQAFLNLLLNSIDAFSRGNTNKRGRQIILNHEKASKKLQNYEFTYNDNAGGIDISNLVIPDKNRNDQNNLNKLLFEPNVSSKGDKGSGWGLFLVRKCINIHSGSIDITRHRGGVTFSISLPHSNNK